MKYIVTLNGKNYEVDVEESSAFISGITDAAVKSSIRTSRVNSIPAMGALKIPAMPAAAPHPTSIINMRGDILNKLPI